MGTTIGRRPVRVGFCCRRHTTGAANKGALYSAGRDQPLPPLVPELTGASCEDGLLGIEIPLQERGHFHDALSMFGIYHDFDYGFFYANIRENVTSRVQAWRSTQERH